MPKLLVCENPNCQKTFLRRIYSISKHNYCSRSCAVIINNRLYPKNPGIIHNCPICGSDFKSRQKFCSKRCQDLSLVVPSKTIVLKIKEFVGDNGRIPLKREITYYKAARARFGTWNKAIKAAGFDPNPVMFANRHIANDGHECDSFSEKIIDDWMFEKGIEHKRDVPYPGNKGFTCDFVIGNKWIEFFGLAGQHKKYDLLKRRKLNLVKRYNIDLVKLFPDDIFPQNKLNLVLNA